MSWHGVQMEDLKPQQVWGAVLAVLSVGLTISLGVVATEGNAVPALLAVLAVAGQFASAWLFANHRKADPAHAKTIVRNMMSLATRLASVVDDIQEVQEQRAPEATLKQLRTTLTQVNVHASTLAEEGIRIVNSWGDFDPATLRELGWSSADGGPIFDDNDREGPEND